MIECSRKLLDGEALFSFEMSPADAFSIKQCPPDFVLTNADDRFPVIVRTRNGILVIENHLGWVVSNFDDEFR